MLKYRQLLLILLLVATSFSAETALLEKGVPAPTFVLPTLSGSREYLRVWCGEKLMKPYINSIKHRVILSFWSTTCAPCMKEIPELHTFAEKHAEDSVKVFLVNLDKHSPAELETFVSEKEWTLPVLRDPYQNTSKRFGVTAIPTLYVISPDGKIEHAFTGIPEGVTADELLETLIYSDNSDVIDSVETDEKQDVQ